MTSEKNILIVSKSSQLGGLEFHVLDLVKVFAQANNVYVMVPPGPLTSKYSEAGAEVIEVYPKSSFDLRFIDKVNKFCTANKIHILHSHELINSQAVFAAFLAGVKKRIYHVHTPFLFWRYSNLFEKVFKTIPNWIANFFTANIFSTDVIALTPQIKIHRILLELVFPTKIKVIPNAVNVKKYADSPNYEAISQFKDKYAVPKDKVILGNISRLTREKGHMVLIKAYQKLIEDNRGKYHLLIAGGGELEEHYKDYVAENIGSKEVTFVGKFNEDEKSLIIHSINYAIFPSLAEGFGYVLTEFMAAKKPVLASNLKVLEQVGGRGVWYFNKGDHKDLLTQLKYLLNLSDKMISENTGEAFRKVNGYSLEAFAKNYSSIYGS